MTDEKAREADDGMCHHQHPMGPPGRIIFSHHKSKPCGLSTYSRASQDDLDAAHDRGKAEGIAEALEACAAALQASLSEVLNDEGDEWGLVREWESTAAEMRKRMKS